MFYVYSKNPKTYCDEVSNTRKKRKFIQFNINMVILSLLSMRMVNE
jgi:hypothetical protein